MDDNRTTKILKITPKLFTIGKQTKSMRRPRANKTMKRSGGGSSVGRAMSASPKNVRSMLFKKIKHRAAINPSHTIQANNLSKSSDGKRTGGNTESTPDPQNEFDESMSYLGQLSDAGRNNIASNVSGGMSVNLNLPPELSPGAHKGSRARSPARANSPYRSNSSLAPTPRLTTPRQVIRSASPAIRPAIRPTSPAIRPTSQAIRPTSPAIRPAIRQEPYPELVRVNIPSDSSVKWGSLKNGNKETYRAWKNRTVSRNKHRSIVGGDNAANIVNVGGHVTGRTGNSNVPTKSTKSTKPTVETKIIKKTTSQKYTVGKHKKKRTVRLIIKNKTMRNKIALAEKKLKNEPISSIRKKLRDKNLLKLGSSVPVHILRKIYETSMMAGDIVNTNNETAVHNLVMDTKSEFM